MQLKALKVFCDVVQQRSFSRAADDNGISQSGASQLVQQLEEHLGVRLIDRSKRPFVLTSEGDLYYNGCRELVQRYFALEDKVRTMHQEVIGRVRVASIYSVGLHLMSSFITTFYKHYPKANVRLEYLHPDRVYESVENDVADIGLVSYPKSSRTIEALPWRDEPMVLVCRPDHPLARRKTMPIAALDGAEMVSFDEELTIRREIDRVLHQHGVAVDVKLAFDNVETIKRAVEVGIGVSVLPEPTVRREVDAGTLTQVPLETSELVRPLGVIYRKGKELSSTAERFIELLRREGNMETTAISGNLIAGNPIAGTLIDGVPIDGVPIDGPPLDGNHVDGAMIDGPVIDGPVIDGPIDDPLDGKETTERTNGVAGNGHGDSGGSDGTNGRRRIGTRRSAAALKASH